MSRDHSVQAPFKWSATLLAGSGAAWCVIVGWKIWFTPVRYLQYASWQTEPQFVYRSFSDVSMLGAVPLVVPTVFAALATWVAWRQRIVALCAVTLIFALFCFVAGFSIGGAYVPVAGALLIATAISLTGAVVARFRRVHRLNRE